MARAFRFGVPLTAATALAFSLPLLADSSTGTKVTIRGSGNQVSVERTPAPARAPRTAARRLSNSDLVADVARQMKAGRSDPEILADLRARQFELPLVIGSGDLVRLKRLGAGEDVVAYLAHATAVDIGPTSDDSHGSSAVSASVQAREPGFAYDEGSAYGYGYGYGGYGGYPVYPAHRVFRTRDHRHLDHIPRPHPPPMRHATMPVRRPQG
jgi:hypothetical protein